MKDLQSDAVVLELWMLGLVGKIVTAPWMRMFYANEKNLTNLETTPAIQTSLHNLKYLQDNPAHSLTTELDIFNGPLNRSDDVIKDLQRPLASQTEEAQFFDIFPKLMSGTIEVLERQLKPYLHGDLATPSVAQLEKSAPTHNIFAEQTLGLTDHQFHRAPNATIGFIDGKVKSRKNKTLEWLGNKSESEQDTIISFSVRQARKVRTIRHQREENVRKIQDQRLKEKQQKYDKSARNKIEKKLKGVFEGNAALNTEFDDLADDQINLIERTMNDVATLSDSYIDHIWYDSGENSLYHGRIIRSKSKAKIPTITVAYRSEDETEVEAEDYKLTVVQLLSDYIAGDVTFVGATRIA